MRTTGAPLLALVLATTLAAEEPPAPSPPKISARLQQEVRVGLPPFTPPPAPKLDQPRGEDSVADPEVLVLQKYTVKEKRPPTHDPDVWLSRSSIQQKAMVGYRDSMTDLEWALNSWYIPLVTPPASVRARAHYENGKRSEEMRRLGGLISEISRLNPAAATELKQELRNLASGRAAGSK